MKRRSNNNTPVTETKPPQVEEEVRRRAHQLYEERGREDGHDVEDWLRAEHEILMEKTRTVAA